MLKGKVLITGGAGFLGRAIMARAQREGWPCEFTIYSRDEQKQVEARKRFGARCVLGDIRDTSRLALVAAGHDVVIHAAALKYIPEAEFNVAECVEVNIMGSRSVINACRGVVPRVLAISTDKAVMPLNLYGASKMTMERMFTDANEWQDETAFLVCRYGNVIGSTGSVIPMFEQQATKGEVTITDTAMTRFWLTPNEAVDIVDYTLDVCARGGIMVYKARAMRLVDLVETLWPFADVRIIGRRAGEKLHESLLSEYEMAHGELQDDDYVVFSPTGPETPGQVFAGMSSNDPTAWMDGPELVEAVCMAAEI